MTQEANLLDPQGSEGWVRARLGKLTASRMADAIAKTRSGWGASRANLRAALIAERLTGVPQDTYTNAAMQWGTENEPQARSAYEFFNDVTVEQVGFIDHPRIPMFGASPDGLVGTDGLLEIKAPNTATQIETLLSGKIPDKYMVQMQVQMACTGRQWCDFASFDPRLTERLRLFVKRVPRDDRRIAELEAQAREFLAEVDATMAELAKLEAA